MIRSIDTDNVYAPELQSNKAMADRGFIVFTNEYFHVIPLIPTIMFIPRDDIIIDRILQKMDKSTKDVSHWVSDIHDLLQRMHYNQI
jgi:hypothetical protein